MTKEIAERLIESLSAMVDVNNIPLDDADTYYLFQEGDTDGIYMMESDWDKYDLKQIKPKNMDELTAAVAMSHGLAVNPHIYTYIKMEHIKPFTYPKYLEVEEFNKILADSRGMLLYKEQRDEILAFLDAQSEEFKEEHKYSINIMMQQIELRQFSLSNRTFFRQRALQCYQMAYLKCHYKDTFDKFRATNCSSN